MANGGPGSPRGPQQTDGPTEDDEFFYDFQLFNEHGDQAERFRKTFYYGELPWYTERPSLALTSFALEFFVRFLPPRDELRYLDMDYASRLTKNACVTPASVLLAMVYADRLNSSNPQYLAQANSCDLFVVSLMVASKFLYDDGVEDEVYNDVWAKAADIELAALNREERRFLEAINWNLFVRPAEYGTVLEDIERRIALRELAKRQRHQWTTSSNPSPTNSATYTELQVLASNPRTLASIYKVLCDYVLKVATVSLVSYCACLLTVAASVSAVHLISLLGEPAVKARNGTTTTTTTQTNDTTNLSCARTGVRVMLQQRGAIGRPQAAGASTTALTPLPTSTYSELFLEHQKELQRVLRSTTEVLAVTSVEEKRSISDFSYTNTNGSICCIRNPMSCLASDGSPHAVASEPRPVKTLDIRFWELLKQLRISTEFIEHFNRPVVHPYPAMSKDVVFA